MKIIRTITYSLIIASLLPGCEKNPSEDELRPVISSIDFNAEQVTPGTTIRVTGNVTDPKGENLTYTWTSSDGTISDPGNISTDWTISPVCQSNSNAKITLTVSNGKSNTTMYRMIPVAMGIKVTGKALFYKTSIPVSGVKIQIGAFSTLTASDGSFIFFHIAPGSNTLKAIKSGFDTVSISENLSTDKAYLIQMTSGTKTRKVFGTIKTIDSVALGGIRILMLNDDRTESSLSAETDNNGYYEINAVPLGTRTFKLDNVSNANNCESTTCSVEVVASDTRMNARMKIERQIDMLKDGWEFKSSDLSAPWNGANYTLTTDGTNSTVTNKMFRAAYCCPIPGDADNPQIIINQRITGSLSWPGSLYYKSPASTQFYMTTDCNAWPDYTVTIYTYWTTPVSAFTEDNISLNSSYKGQTLKLTFGLLRWSGKMPLWEIKSLLLSYFY